MPEILNKTTTAGLSVSQIEKYYSRSLLMWLKGNLVYANHGQKKTMPANNGSTIQFRKVTPWGPNTTPLTEGVVPDGLEMSMSEVTATVKPYGDYVQITDWLDLTSIDDHQRIAVEQLRNRAKETIDHLCINELKNSSNVIFSASGGTDAASQIAVTPAHKLTTKQIRKAVRFLKKKKVPQFMRNGKGYYYCYVCPDTVFDLQDDEKWENVAKYQQAEKIENGEIGKLYGVVFLDATNPVLWHGEDLASDSRTLLVNGAISSAGKSVTFDGGTVAADALIGRYVIVNGIKAKVTDNTTTTLTLDTDVTAADNAVIYPGEGGQDGCDVYGTPVFGEGAYGTVSIDGGDNVQIIVNGFGSAGTADPINQKASIAYKIKAFCCKILNNDCLVMIKHGVSA